MLLALGAGCKRESPVLVQEVIIPVGFHGWLQIVQDDPNCPKAELRHRRIVPGSDHSGVICIAEELPALGSDCKAKVTPIPLATRLRRAIGLVVSTTM